MEQSITLLVAAVGANDIRELSFAETLLIGGTGGIEEFPVIPR